MTRAEWERKHRLYHPHPCRDCGGFKEHRCGGCGRCADAKARSETYRSMRRKPAA